MGGTFPRLSIPSLTINGDLDRFFCDHAEDCSSSEALAGFEQQFYAPVGH